MNKKMRWLSGLLVLQLIIAGGLFVETGTASTEFQPKPLLSFQADRVDRVLLSDGEQEIVLHRDSNQWRLPGLQNLPVDTLKLDAVLQKLEELKTTWPVTTSTSSHSRLEVAPDKFERRVRLYAGEELLGELFLGTSPGFKKVYLRSASDDNVYSLALNSYEFKVNAFDWLDKELLEVKNTKAIEEKDLKLVKSGSDWKLLDETGGDSAQERPAVDLDTNKVAEITEALGNILVTGVAEKAPDFSSPETVSLNVSGEDDWAFQLLKNDDTYYIKRGDIDAVFMIGEQTFNKLASIRRQDILASNNDATIGAPEQGPADVPKHGG